MILILFICVVLCESHSVLRLQRQAFQNDNLECASGEMYYIHPADCRFFYRCLEHQNNDYQKFYTRCPRETIFSIEHATCVPGNVENCSNGGNYSNKEKNRQNRGKVNGKIKCLPKHRIGKGNYSNENNVDIGSSVNMNKQITNKDRNTNGKQNKNYKRIITNDEKEQTRNNGRINTYNNHRNSLNQNKYNNQNDNNYNNNKNKENLIINEGNTHTENSNINKNVDYQYNSNDDQNDRFIKSKYDTSENLIRIKDKESTNDESSASNNKNSSNGNNLQGNFNNMDINFRDNISLTQNYGTTSTISKATNKSNFKSTISPKLEMTGYLQNPITDSIYTNQSLLQMMAESLKLIKRKLPFTTELTGLETLGKLS